LIQYSTPPELVFLIPPQGIKGLISNVSELIIILAKFNLLAISNALLLSLSKIAILSPCSLSFVSSNASFKVLISLIHKLEQKSGFNISSLDGFSFNISPSFSFRLDFIFEYNSFFTKIPFIESQSFPSLNKTFFAIWSLMFFVSPLKTIAQSLPSNSPKNSISFLHQTLLLIFHSLLFLLLHRGSPFES